MVHPFESGTVQGADTTHGQFHDVRGERGPVSDGGEELEEAAGESWGDQERAVEWTEAELAAILYELFEEGLLCGVGEEGRVRSICEPHLDCNIGETGVMAVGFCGLVSKSISGRNKDKSNKVQLQRQGEK